MSKSFDDYVNDLTDDEFDFLIKSINKRIDKKKYGETNFEDLAIKYGRKPTCPKCGSKEYINDGYTSAYHSRYRCKDCDCSYTLLSNSIFNSAKLSLHTVDTYIKLMSYNVPLELLCEIVGISANTAELWRKKIFNTVNDYQDHLVLSGNVWIDETYVEDYKVLATKDGKHIRGLSKSKICIVVAIDQHQNMVAIIAGHGKPSSKRIIKALKSHIKENSTIIHDGEHAHYKLIEDLKAEEEYYKANIKNKEYLEHMELINSMCSWIKSYIWRFTSMRVENLQSYLNWFIYLQRVKKQQDKWGKSSRIMRHLLLDESKFIRKY